MKSKKVKISITIDNELIEKLKVIADEEDSSVSRIINLILRKYFNNN